MNRFEELATGYGFQITPVYAMINNVWCRRPDIVGVNYRGHNIMTAPAKPLNFPDPNYKTLDGMEQPMYFDREYRLRNWYLILKNTPHLHGIIEKKMKLKLLEANKKNHE